MGRGSADPVASGSVGILAFNPGCDLGFTSGKQRWPRFQFKSCIISACLEMAAGCILGTATQHVKTTQPRFYALGL